MYKTALLIGIIVLFGTSPAHSQEEAATGPVFELEKTEYDLGVIGPDELEVVGSVVISNPGNQPLEITRVLSSGKSFSGYFGETTIEPSREGVLFISYYKNKIAKGKSRQMAQIRTNDPKKPYAVVYFNFTVERNAEQEDRYQLYKEIQALRSEVQALRRELKAALEGDTPLQKQPAAKKPSIDTTVYDIEIGDSPVLGNPKAPVTIVQFGDFQCPYCVREYAVLKTILKDYPDQVRLVYKHFPLSFHKKAKPAQAAAEFAKQQLGNDGFWTMHDLIMDNPKKLDPPDLIAYAKQMGLDTEALSKLLNDPEKIDALFAPDLEQAQKCNVQGTPTILINGQKLSNRTPDSYRQRIDTLLKK